MPTIPASAETSGQTQRRWRKRSARFSIRRGLLGFVIALIALSALGATYQALAIRSDRRSYPPPGQLVEVNGRSLHLYIMGKERGGPTVILDAALGFPSAEWAWVQPEVAHFARVVAYDRAGLGWSDAGQEPRTFEQNAEELHTALHNAGIAGP